MTPHPVAAIFSAATMVLRNKHGLTREDLHRAIDAHFDDPEPPAGPKLRIIQGGSVTPVLPGAAPLPVVVS
ncbi:MAG TPA: hypothetical protein VMQ73_01775 [Methylomirabilota bacterium]|nr:hypothetical protein [Methylomirabilota bacterium]